MNLDIEQARQKLDKHLSGYVHPEKTNLISKHAYKTIDVKKENADYTSSSKPIIPYKNFDASVTDQNQKNINDYCPVCNEKALYICTCQKYNDMMCKNNHYWWYDEKGFLKEGDPHFQ